MHREHELDSLIAWSGESGQPQFDAELLASAWSSPTGAWEVE